MLMDSMRSLNTSLPSSSTRRPKSVQPSVDLLQAFKAAALSVTQLYKTAASDEDAARAAGYQDAVEELLAFLDSENLGLGDGEGWRVRQWATERVSPASYGSDTEDNNMDDESTTPLNNNHSSSSITKTVETRSVDSGSSKSPSETPARNSGDSSAESTSAQPQDTDQTKAASEIFRFRSSVPFPTAAVSADSEMVNDEVANGSADNSNSTPVVRLVPRTSRSRNQLRDKSLGNIVAGMKRKTSVNDFFDFGSFARDGSPGAGGVGKKFRFV